MKFRASLFAAGILLFIPSVENREQSISLPILGETKGFWVPWFRGLLGLVTKSQDVLLPCAVCVPILEEIISNLKGNYDVQAVVDSVKPLCSLIGSHDDICPAIIQLYGPSLVWLLSNHTIDVQAFCALAAKSAMNAMSPDCDLSGINPEKWLVQLPDVKKPLKQSVEIPVDAKPFKVLHLADIHLDMLYKVGTEADCGHITCCQAESGPGVKNPAGRFGTLGPCDTPLVAVEDAFEHIVATHPDINLVIFTGDIPAHDIWLQSVERNLASTAQGYETIRKYFGNKTVLNLLGNHDVHPCNLYVFDGLSEPEELNTRYIYEDAWKHWKHWLPGSEKENVLKSGQYSVSPVDGLRVLAFNNMFGYVLNWLVWTDVEDPNGQLAWLAKELQLAEDAGEKVFLMGHVPPGSPDMTPIWSHNFYRIVNRYESIIKAQFYGHTHYDEFSVFFNEQGEASNVAFISPSLTPHVNLNYGYRIFHFDGQRNQSSSWSLMNHETWIYQLEKANKKNITKWYKSYSMKNEYHMIDLSPESFAALGKSLVTDDAVFKKYYRHYWKNSPKKPHCDMNCRLTLACDTMTSDVTDESHCLD